MARRKTSRCSETIEEKSRDEDRSFDKDLTSCLSEETQGRVKRLRRELR